MPDRVIRDELLTSERYWLVSIQAQQLYIHLLLVADDAARFSGKNFTLRTSCFPGRPMDAQVMEKMLQELIDVDLIRVYVANGERYVFVPRFRNRKRYMASSKYPTPPNEINDLATEKADLGQPKVSPKSALSQEERGRRGVGEEKDKHTARASPLPSRGSAGDPGFTMFWSAYPRKIAKANAMKAWAKIAPSTDMLDEIIAAVKLHSTTRDWTKDDGQFIPHPATWLNARRWEDAIGSQADPFELGRAL